MLLSTSYVLQTTSQRNDFMIDGNKILSSLPINVANMIEANKDYLCELDSEVGDGDHGVSMTIGMRTARESSAKSAKSNA